MKKIHKLRRHVELLDDLLNEQENARNGGGNCLLWDVFVGEMLARTRRLEAELLLIDDNCKVSG